MIHISILLQTTSWLHQRCDTISIDAYIFHKKNYYNGRSVKGQIKSLLFSLNKTIIPDHPRGSVNKTLFFPTM